MSGLRFPGSSKRGKRGSNFRRRLRHRNLSTKNLWKADLEWPKTLSSDAENVGIIVSRFHFQHFPLREKEPSGRENCNPAGSCSASGHRTGDAPFPMPSNAEHYSTNKNSRKAITHYPSKTDKQLSPQFRQVHCRAYRNHRNNLSNCIPDQRYFYRTGRYRNGPFRNPPSY